MRQNLVLYSLWPEQRTKKNYSAIHPLSFLKGNTLGSVWNICIYSVTYKTETEHLQVQTY